MENLKYFIIFLGVFLALSFPRTLATECGSTPTAHCVVTQDTTFSRGNYLVTNITLAADNIILDCNSAILNGSNHTNTITPLLYVGGTSGNTIKNCDFVAYSSGAITNYRDAIPEAIGYFTITNNNFDSSGSRSNAIQLEEPQLSSNQTRSRMTSHSITRNTIAGEHKIGIALHNANDSYIGFNNISIESSRESALILEGGSFNLVEFNTLTQGKMVFLRGVGTAINTTIQFNTIEGAQTGIELWEGVPNYTIVGNTFRNNNLAMWVRASNGLILANTIESTGSSTESTTGGIFFDSPTNPSNNLIILNNFNDIDEPASDGGTNNMWHTNYTLPLVSLSRQMYGNYYSQFSQNTQMNSRGQPCTNFRRISVCDNPFFFSGNNDSYALRSSAYGSVVGPIIQPVPEVIISESESAIIEINASGYNETLYYSVSDPNFVQVPGAANQFAWLTNFQHTGQYKVNVTVTDPFNIEDRVEVNVTILNANDDCSLYPARIANGCVVYSDVTFPTGTYLVPDGISIGASNVAVDCSGAVMQGNIRNNAGIGVSHHDFVTIKNCAMKNYQVGINLSDASYNTILNVQAGENEAGGNFGLNGIELFNAHNNIIRNSNLSENGDTGIVLYASNNNLIAGNKVNSNENSAGIALLGGSGNNTITNNIVKDNDNGGIVLSIWVALPLPNDNNVIMGNTVEDTRQNYGIFLRRGNNNIIYHNNLINNRNQVRDLISNVGNQWSFNQEGNYYSDHACGGGEGKICPNPYTFSSNVDPFPFRQKNGWLPAKGRDVGKITISNIPFVTNTSGNFTGNGTGP